MSRTKRDPDLKITQEGFDRMPMLVSRSVFMAWTGYSDEEVSAAVKSGEILVRRTSRDAKKCKYFKSQIAGICGLKY